MSAFGQQRSLNYPKKLDFHRALPPPLSFDLFQSDEKVTKVGSGRHDKQLAGLRVMTGQSNSYISATKKMEPWRNAVVPSSAP